MTKAPQFELQCVLAKEKEGAFKDDVDKGSSRAGKRWQNREGYSYTGSHYISLQASLSTSTFLAVIIGSVIKISQYTQ